MSRYLWIVWSVARNWFECRRCKGVLKPKLPMKATRLCVYAKVFEDAHRKCKEAK